MVHPLLNCLVYCALIASLYKCDPTTSGISVSAATLQQSGRYDSADTHSSHPSHSLSSNTNETDQNDANIELKNTESRRVIQNITANTMNDNNTSNSTLTIAMCRPLTCANSPLSEDCITTPVGLHSQIQYNATNNRPHTQVHPSISQNRPYNQYQTLTPYLPTTLTNTTQTSFSTHVSPVTTTAEALAFNECSLTCNSALPLIFYLN